MTFYLIIAGMLFLSGMIFGQNINMTFIWWVNITSITASFFTIAGIGFAYKAYKVWHRPILSELTGSLSEVMLNRELAYAKLTELIYFSSHNSNTENVIDEKRLVAFHSFHISVQALWSRGSYLVKSIVLYEASSSSLIDYWSEYNFNEIITNCINEKNYINSLKEISNYRNKNQNKTDAIHSCLAELAADKGWNYQEKLNETTEE